MTALPDTVVQTGTVTAPNPVPVPIPVDLSIAVAAATAFAGRAEDAATSAEALAGDLADAVSSAASSAIAAAGSAATATTQASTATTAATTATTQATAASASASATAMDLALVQSAMESIAAVSVPVLPWLIDGLPPSVLLLAGSGAMMLGGLYVADSAILTVSAAAKWVEGFDGTLYLSPANQPAYNWRTLGGVRVREILIEPAGATNLVADSLGWSGTLGGADIALSSGSLLGVTAARVWQAATNTYQSRYFTVACAASTTYTRSVIMKSDGHRWVYLQQYDGSTNLGAVFDLQTGTIGTVQAGCTAAIVPLGGAYLCSVTNTTAVGASSERLQISLARSATDVAPVYAGDGVSGVLAILPQIETGAVASSRIPTSGTAATRISDDVRLTAAALAQAATETGATIVISGDWSAGGYILGGEERGNIALVSGADVRLWRGDDGGALDVSPGTGSLADMCLAMAFSPSSASAALNGGAAASAATTSASWSLAEETAVRIGATPNGYGAAPRVYLRSLRIHPYIAVATGLQAASEV